MDAFRGREWPRRQLASFVILSHLAVFIPNTILLAGINLPVTEITNFLNQSATSEYGLNLDENQLQLGYGLLASIPTVAAIPGTLLARYTADKWGRKVTIFWGATSAQIASAGITAAAYYSTNLLVLYLARAVYGLGFGMLMGAMNLYVSECTPVLHRGMVGNMATVIINICSTTAVIVSLPEILGSQDRWHFMFLATIPVSILALVLSCFLPESPKYDYIQRNRPDLAAKTIQLYHGRNEDISKVFSNFDRERAQSSHHVTLREIRKTPHLRMGLVISILISSTRVTSGVLLIFLFSKGIYRDQLNLSDSTANYVTLGLMFATIFAALWGAFQIDHHGRRPMFLGCSFLMLILTVLFVLFGWLGKNHVPWMRYLGLACIAGVYLAYSVAPNTLQFFFITEIVPQTARALVSTISLICSLVLRIIYFTIFPVLQRVLGEFSLAILVVVPTIPTLWYLYREMPETKGQTVHAVVEGMIRRYSAAAPTDFTERSEEPEVLDQTQSPNLLQYLTETEGLHKEEFEMDERPLRTQDI